jgi:hypothetical protein
MLFYLGFILLMKSNLVEYKFTDRTINIILWTFFGLFILNTVGNIFAKTNFEKLFAILTALLALLIWNILKHKKTRNRVSCCATLLKK